MYLNKDSHSFSSVGILNTISKSDQNENVENQFSKVPRTRALFSGKALRLFVVVTVFASLAPIAMRSSTLRNSIPLRTIRQWVFSHYYHRVHSESPIEWDSFESPKENRMVSEMMDNMPTAVKVQKIPDIDFVEVETLRHTLAQSVKEVEQMKHKIVNLESRQTDSPKDEHYSSSEIERLKSDLNKLESLSSKSTEELNRKLEIAQKELHMEQRRVQEISRRMDEDSEADFATTALGAQIVSSLTSSNGPNAPKPLVYVARALVKYLNSERYRSVFMNPSTDASVVIDPSPIRGPGDCFFASAPVVDITIEFPIPITLKRVGIKHISKAIDPIIDVAPKDFRLFVTTISDNEVNETQINFDFQFESLASAPSTQFFPVSIDEPIKRVRFQFINHKSGICIYRLNTMGNLEWRINKSENE